MEDNYEITITQWRNLKIFFSRIARPIQIKLGRKHPLVKDIQICSNEVVLFKDEIIMKEPKYMNEIQI